MEGISAVSGEAEDGTTAVAAVGDGRLLANVLEDSAASGRLDPIMLLSRQVTQARVQSIDGKHRRT